MSSKRLLEYSFPDLKKSLFGSMKCISDARKAVSAYGPLMLLYFCSSCSLAFPMVSVAGILNQEIALSSSELALYYTAIFVPWNFRALYGLFSDLVPIFGFRRIIYMIMGNLILGACYLLYAAVVTSDREAFAVGVTMNIFFAFSEAVLDAAVVEKIRVQQDDAQSSLERTRRSCDIQSASMTFRTLGSVLSFLVAGSLSTCFEPRTIIAMSATFPFISSIVILIARDTIETRKPREQVLVFEKTSLFITYIKKCISERRWPVEMVTTISPVLIPSIFILLYASSPSSNVVFMSYLYSLNSLDQFQFHIVTLCGMIGGLLGTLIYWASFRRVEDHRKIFAISILFSVLASGSRLLIIYYWKQVGFICFDEMLVNIAARFTLMPVQVYASIAASTPEHMMYEGFVFGFFASIENWGGTISGLISSEMAVHLNVTMMIITCASISVLPLFALSLLKARTRCEKEIKPISDLEVTKTHIIT